jgi:hexokinase
MTSQLLDSIYAPDYQQVKKNFLNELTLASVEKHSSISFIKHNFSNKPILSQGIVQGIVIGGTNFILSTERIGTNGEKEILTRETGMLPALSTKQRFTDFLSNLFDSRADAVGINFGFKLLSTQGEDGTLDGIIQAKGTKEHTFTGVTESVGTIARQIFWEKYHKKVVVSVANDTISMLLSGRGNERASMIVGTGFNMGLRLNGTTLVNLEAGDFNKFEPSEILNEIDSTTKNPEKKLFEKSISGMYVPKHFNILAKKLGIMVAPVHTGQELTAIAHSYHDEKAMDLARVVLFQSASLVASAIAGLYDFYTEQGVLSPNQTLIIIGEGGLLWDGWHYHESIMKQLQALGLSKDKVTIEQIKDSAINGALGLIIQ